MTLVLCAELLAPLPAVGSSGRSRGAWHRTIELVLCLPDLERSRCMPDMERKDGPIGDDLGEWHCAPFQLVACWALVARLVDP